MVEWNLVKKFVSWLNSDDDWTLDCLHIADAIYLSFQWMNMKEEKEKQMNEYDFYADIIKWQCSVLRWNRDKHLPINFHVMWTVNSEHTERLNFFVSFLLSVQFLKKLLELFRKCEHLFSSLKCSKRLTITFRHRTTRRFHLSIFSIRNMFPGMKWGFVPYAIC